MSPAAIALCILVPLFIFTLVFVAWVYPEPDNSDDLKSKDGSFK